MDASLRILEAAEQLCLKHLPQKVTIDMIAAHARVSKGTVYNSFNSKDDLFQKLALSLIENLRVVMMDAGLSSSGSSLERLERLGTVYHEYMRKHPIIIAITVFLSETPPWLNTGEKSDFFRIESVLVTMVESLVKLGITEGVFRSDIATETLAYFILAVFRSRNPMFKKVKSYVSSKTVRDLILNGAGVH